MIQTFVHNFFRWFALWLPSIYVSYFQDAQTKNSEFNFGIMPIVIEAAKVIVSQAKEMIEIHAEVVEIVNHEYNIKRDEMEKPNDAFFKSTDEEVLCGINVSSTCEKNYFCMRHLNPAVEIRFIQNPRKK